jgi:hypothetical protein
MATMYENFCGNSVDGVELTFHKRVLDFFYTIAHSFDNFQNCCQLYPTHTVAT